MRSKESIILNGIGVLFMLYALWRFPDAWHGDWKTLILTLTYGVLACGLWRRWTWARYAAILVNAALALATLVLSAKIIYRTSPFSLDLTASLAFIVILFAVPAIYLSRSAVRDLF